MLKPTLIVADTNKPITSMQQGSINYQLKHNTVANVGIWDMKYSAGW